MKKYSTIYTIGCFDWFHYGHLNLFLKMKKLGNEIIVGIHDDDSIEKLKKLNKKQHQSIDIRMSNIKPYCDRIFVIPSTDPTFFIKCMIKNTDNKSNSCFVRADDMPNFPGRKLIETKMNVILLPYTHGISSTLIRNNLN